MQHSWHRVRLLVLDTSMLLNSPTGIQVNICAENFASIVTDLSLDSSRLNDVFFLNDTPDVDTLVVTIDSENFCVRSCL